MKLLQRATALFALLIAGLLASGCTTTLVLIYAHAKLTEGDPAPCVKLNSVERALRERCGPFVHGSLLTKDVTASGLPQCPLTLAARDPKFWPVLPELLAKGALPEACLDAPLVALAQRHACPDFATASRAELQALRWLAVADARSIHHDAVRMPSCPNARAAGLHDVLDGWLAQGLLPAKALAFSPLGALHASHLRSDFAQKLQAQGHSHAQHSAPTRASCPAVSRKPCARATGTHSIGGSFACPSSSIAYRPRKATSSPGFRSRGF